jgi:hypothetical protein
MYIMTQLAALKAGEKHKIARIEIGFYVVVHAI